VIPAAVVEAVGSEGSPKYLLARTGIQYFVMIGRTGRLAIECD